ncbi:MAG: radical SAM/SPASM domain-containing protein [Bdellovibrionota bacterium]
MNVFRYGTTDFFKAVEIETMTACNRRCSYCPNSKFDRGLIKNNRLMDVSVFQNVIDQLSEIGFGGRISPHFYNEPLMDERIFELMAYTRSKLPRAEITIFSNGDYLDVETYEKLGKSGVTALNISQHGDRMPAGVKAVLEIANSPRRASEGLPTVLYKVPKDEVALNSRGGLVEGSSKAPTLEYCGAPTHTLTIDFEGNVVLCCNDYLSTVKWGNIKDEKIVAIWQKKEFQKLRRKLRQGSFELEICRICANPQTAQA